jgi:hypothetical protein
MYEFGLYPNSGAMSASKFLGKHCVVGMQALARIQVVKNLNYCVSRRVYFPVLRSFNKFKQLKGDSLVMVLELGAKS